jgi:hypothetical protein
MQSTPFHPPLVWNDDYLSNHWMMTTTTPTWQPQQWQKQWQCNQGNNDNKTTRHWVHDNTFAITQHYDCAVAVSQNFPPLVKCITTLSLFIKFIKY